MAVQVFTFLYKKDSMDARGSGSSAAFSNEITERFEEDLQIREPRASFFYAVQRHGTDPVLVPDRRGRVAINNTMAIDLFGQCASDCLGWNQHSATGGQVDFTRGAQDSEGGKAFICTTSSVMKGGKRVSKIMPFFPPGSAVTTARTDVQFVVTEYGCVNLKPLTMKDRVWGTKKDRVSRGPFLCCHEAHFLDIPLFAEDQEE